MRRLVQSRVGEDGTCFRTCLASILNLKEAQVPDFKDANLDPAVNPFLRKYGLQYEEVPAGDVAPSGIHLALGTSPRGGQHAVVCKDGKLLHDPHPQDGTGRGLVDVKELGVADAGEEKSGGRDLEPRQYKNKKTATGKAPTNYHLGKTCTECGGPVPNSSKPNSWCQGCLAQNRQTDPYHKAEGDRIRAALRRAYKRENAKDAFQPIPARSMTRAQFMAILRQYGVTLDTSSEDWDSNIDAPKGKVFRANGAHCIVEPYRNNGGQSWKSAAYEEAVRRVRMGLLPYDDLECDVCADAKDSVTLHPDKDGLQQRPVVAEPRRGRVKGSDMHIKTLSSYSPRFLNSRKVAKTGELQASKRAKTFEAQKAGYMSASCKAGHHGNNRCTSAKCSCICHPSVKDSVTLRPDKDGEMQLRYTARANDGFAQLRRLISSK